jgi:hypothetical protein
MLMIGIGEIGIKAEEKKARNPHTHLAPFAGKGSEVKARRWFAAHSAQLIHLKHAIVIIVISHVSYYMHQERGRRVSRAARNV